MGIYHIVDKNDFQKKLTKTGTKLALVFFYVTWGIPCKIIAPKLEELEFHFRDLVILKVNVDTCPDIAELYNVIAMPTFFMIRNGKSLGHFIGAEGYLLNSFVEKHMGITH